MSRDAYATALGTTLAEPKDISPRVKSPFFFTRGYAGYWDIQAWVNEMYQASATPRTKTQ